MNSTHLRSLIAGTSLAILLTTVLAFPVHAAVTSSDDDEGDSSDHSSLPIAGGGDLAAYETMTDEQLLQAAKAAAGDKEAAIHLLPPLCTALERANAKIAVQDAHFAGRMRKQTAEVYSLRQQLRALKEQQSPQSAFTSPALATASPVKAPEELLSALPTAAVPSGDASTAVPSAAPSVAPGDGDASGATAAASGNANSDDSPSSANSAGPGFVSRVLTAINLFAKS